MNILAISGSLRSGSTNSYILRTAASLTPEDAHFTYYESLGDLPHFSPELDNENPPASVTHFRNLLQAADGVMICTPEYAFGVPGSLKNVLDWTVSSGDFSGKPVAVISASTSGDKALASLLLTFTALDARIPEEASLLISTVRAKVDKSGQVIDFATMQALKTVVDALVDTIQSPEMF